MDLTVDFKAFQEQVTSSLVDVTRSAGQIANEDLGFHRSSSQKLSRAIDSQNVRLLQLTSRLLKAASQDSGISAPRVQDQEGVEDNWTGVVDVVDDLLEKTDASLDEFSGVIKRLSPSPQDGASTPPKLKDKSARVPMIYWNTTIRKPQLDFANQANNYEERPFKPLLKVKPHAIISLEQSIGNGGSNRFDHPYAHEIEQATYPPQSYVVAAPVAYTPPSENEPILVDTEEAVLVMLDELRHAKEIAVDLEHHDMHSYVGVVCLMQISTREKDWLVDTLKPWREELQVLNEVFADPRILKVFHGSNMDIIWLQRDLGLYVVNLFDTYHASVALNFPKKNLGYLLDRFAGFQAQKKYQLADWRVRPMPPELIDYARSDTHYLLLVHDHLRNMLIEASTPGNDLVKYVMAASKREALQTYERPVYDIEHGLGPAGWFRALAQRSVRFDNQQFAVFRALHHWRDEKAKALDESDHYVLPPAALWEISEKMPLTVSYLYKCLRPVPKIVADYSKEIVETIKQAKVAGLDGPSVRDMMRTNEEKFGTSTWNKRQRRSSQDGHQGVGQTMQMLAANGEIGKKPESSDSIDLDQSTSATRSRVSRLWGSTLPSVTTTSAGSSMAAATAALASVLPLNLFFDASISTLTTQSTDSAPGAELFAAKLALNYSVPVIDQKDDIFVIRDLARNKKRKAEEEPGLESSDLPSLPIEQSKYSLAAAANGEAASPPTDPILQERIRKQAKQQKKAEKRARKEARVTEARETQAQLQAAEPFDYANAESILHAKNDGLGVNGSGKERKRPMNPFAKALDTGTGAKRLKQGKEMPGKSMTFKS